MSFTICSTTSTNYQSLCSIQCPVHQQRGQSPCRPQGPGLLDLSVPFQQLLGWLGSGGLAARMARDLAGMGDIHNEKDTMQSLNDCLTFLPGQGGDSGPQRDHGRPPAQYDELAQKNQEELDKYWSQKTEEHTIVVTTQSTKMGADEMTLTELRCVVQSLEINLDSMRNLKASLENSLREAEARYAMQMEQLNRVLLHLDLELTQTWEEGQHQAQVYKILLNIKVKLEAEIATYCRLLEDGEDFNCGDALDSSNSMQTIQMTIQDSGR
ncbi:Keratin, type I cytoskeletal 18 [Plecturocebus cupreus]